MKFPGAAPKLTLSALMVFSFIAIFPDKSIAEPRDQKVFAHVNGQSLSLDTYQFLLGSRNREDQERAELPVSAEEMSAMRSQAAQDLVITEVLAQQALRMKVDQQPENKVELELARKTLLAQLMVREIISNIAISEAAIRAVYDAEKPTSLFRFNLWMTPSESEANKLLNHFQTSSALNHSYETIETPWLDQAELDPSVIEAVKSTQVGDFVPQVIKQDGLWKVVQLVDKNTLDIPPYKDAREIIKADLIQAQVDAEIEKLSSMADIQVNSQHIH